MTELSPKRKMRITGSRIGAILGLSPWQKPDDVIRAMVREHHGAESEFTGNIATDYGKNHETRALLAFMRKTGLTVDQNCGFFEFGDRMGATPDGICSDGAVLELKCPFGLRKGGEFKALAEQPHYEAQVQLEMLSSGAPFAYFAQYNPPNGDPLAHDYVPEQIEIERVERDPKFMDKHHAKLDAFYRRLLIEVDNPEHLEALRVVVDSEPALEIVQKIDELRARQKADKVAEAELLKALIDLCDGKNSDVHGRKLTKVVTTGSVSYAKVVADHLPDIDLDPYRGTPRESWRFT